MFFSFSGIHFPPSVLKLTTSTIQIAFLVIIKSSPTSLNFLIKTSLQSNLTIHGLLSTHQKNQPDFNYENERQQPNLKPVVKNSAAVIGVFLPAHYIIERINRRGIFFDYPLAADFQFVQCKFEMIHGDAHIQILDVDVP